MSEAFPGRDDLYRGASRSGVRASRILSQLHGSTFVKRSMKTSRESDFTDPEVSSYPSELHNDYVLIFLYI